MGEYVFDIMKVMFKLSTKRGDGGRRVQFSSVIFYLVFLGIVAFFVWQYGGQARNYARHFGELANFEVVNNDKARWESCGGVGVHAAPLLVDRDIALYLQGSVAIVINTKGQCMQTRIKGVNELLESIYEFSPGFDLFLLGEYRQDKLIHLKAFIVASGFLNLVDLLPNRENAAVLYSVKNKQRYSYIVLVQLSNKITVHLIMLDSSGQVRRAFLGEFTGKLVCNKNVPETCIRYILNNSDTIKLKFLQLTKFIK